MTELACPICDAELPLSGDESAGEEIQCPYCHSPLTVKVSRKKDDFELDEDF